jgi:hypothetical protein
MRRACIAERLLPPRLLHFALNDALAYVERKIAIA